MRNKSLLAVRYCVFAAAAVFVSIGLWCGEPQEVLQKAVKICLECIGIG